MEERGDGGRISSDLSLLRPRERESVDNDLNADGWQDAWVANYPEVDLSKPLEDLNGDGLPVYLEMSLGLDPFDEQRVGDNFSWQDRHRQLVAKVEAIERNRALTDKTLNHGILDEDGNPCRICAGRNANLKRLQKIAQRLESASTERRTRVDSWMKSHSESSLTGRKTNRPSDIVGGHPEWTSGLSHQLADETRSCDFWPGDPQSQLPYQLYATGDGQTIHMWDTDSVEIDHEQFSLDGMQRVTNAEGGTIPSLGHATAIASLMCGSGDPAVVNPGAISNLFSGNPEFSRGSAYQAKIIAYNLEGDVSDMVMALMDQTTPMYLSNHSYGTNCGWERESPSELWKWYGRVSSTFDTATEDIKFGKYRMRERDVDALSYAAPEYLAVWAAGNDRGNQSFAELVEEGESNGLSLGSSPNQQGNGIEHIVFPGGGPEAVVPASRKIVRPPDSGNTAGGYDTLRPEATTKNILSVTAGTGGSAGPTDDGRLKPDLFVGGAAGFGAAVISDPMDTPEFDLYARFIDSSSAAAAGVTAGLAQLREIWQRNRTDGYPLWGSTLKATAIAASSLDRLPDYAYGWGEFDALRGAYLLNLASDPGGPAHHPVIKQTYLPYTENGDGVIEFKIEQSSFGAPFQAHGGNGGTIEVTLCWTDPATEFAHSDTSLDEVTKLLVNDIDIEVIGSDGVKYQPYVLDPDDPDATAQPGNNTRDNVEKVSVPFAPNGEILTVQITHKDLLKDDDPSDEVNGTTPKPQPVSIVLCGAKAIPEPFRIETFLPTDVSGSGYRITWRSNVGNVYVIEKSTDCVVWAPLAGEYVASGSETTADVTINPVLREFYRIRRTF